MFQLPLAKIIDRPVRGSGFKSSTVTLTRVADSVIAYEVWGVAVRSFARIKPRGASRFGTVLRTSVALTSKTNQDISFIGVRRVAGKTEHPVCAMGGSHC